MKKLTIIAVALLMCVALLSCSVPSPTILRGVAFGMSKKQVRRIEKENVGREPNYEFDRFLYYYYVPFCDYSSEIEYTFSGKGNRLTQIKVEAWIDQSDIQSVFADFWGYLEADYGKPKWIESVSPDGERKLLADDGTGWTAEDLFEYMPQNTVWVAFSNDDAHVVLYNSSYSYVTMLFTAR